MDRGSRIESSRKGSERGFGAAFFGPCPTDTHTPNLTPLFTSLFSYWTFTMRTASQTVHLWTCRCASVALPCTQPPDPQQRPGFNSAPRKSSRRHELISYSTQHTTTVVAPEVGEDNIVIGTIQHCNQAYLESRSDLATKIHVCVT